MERPRLVINEDDARIPRWPPVVQIKDERNEDDAYRFSGKNRKKPNLCYFLLIFFLYKIFNKEKKP